MNGRFRRLRALGASSAVALVVAALVFGLSTVVLPQRAPTFELSSAPNTFDITSAIYPSPACSGAAGAKLYPGYVRCAVFTVQNLLDVPITVQSITSTLDTTSHPPPPANCAPPSYFTLPHFSGTFTVAADATTTMPSGLGVPVELLDSHDDQGACENFTYHFLYTGTAQFTDSTTTSLVSSINPSDLGQSVTLTATVTASNPGIDAGTVAGGTVNFYSCPTAGCSTTTGLLGSGTINASGQVRATTSALLQGATYVQARYLGAGTDFSASNSDVIAQDVQAGTATTISSTPNPSVSGSSATFTAAVTKTGGSGAPTGFVTFYSGTPTGTHTLLATNPVNPATDTATYSTSTLAVGPDRVFAAYDGDSSFSGSTSPVDDQVVVTGACVTGTVNGGYTVKSGQFICFTGKVNGAVVVQADGGAYLRGATVNGGVIATDATSLTMCASQVNGVLTVTGTTGSVLIGDAGDDGVPGCGTNAITGVVTVSGGHGGVELGGNKITAGVSISANTGGGPAGEDAAPEVEGNTITGALACATTNSPMVTDGGMENEVTGVKSGQCAGSGF